MHTYKTIVETQYHLARFCRQGYRQDIQHGEFENEDTYRLQVEPIHIRITDPLDFSMLPVDVPLGVVENYYHELLNPVCPPNSDYTYGERIMIQLPIIMDMLKDTPNTNQAIIEIGRPEDVFLTHQPCLRLIHFMVYSGRLNISVYFRSNDIGAAFIINHCGLALLLRDVAEYAGFPVGEYHYYSAGAHVYSHAL